MKTTSFLLVFLLISRTLFGQVTDGLVGDFPFTAGSFTDEAGYQNGALSTSIGDGTYYTVPDRFGNEDCAIDFQGAVITAGTNDRTILSEISVSLWINTTDTPDGYRFLITKYGLNLQDVPIAGYSMLYYDTVRFDSRDEDWHHNQYMASNYSQTLVNDGEWHHVVGISRNDTAAGEAVLEIWVDGVMERSNRYAWIVTDLNNPTKQLCIAGSDNYSTHPTFKGIMDDIKIYKRGLDSLEIVALLNAPDPFVKPTVLIFASDTAVCELRPIQFTSETTDADSIIWNFGDGTSSMDQNPEHAYDSAGTYLVTARVKNQSSGLFASDTLLNRIHIYANHEDSIELDVSENSLPYQFGSQSLTDSGFYTETFMTSFGCDSVVTLHLQVHSAVGIPWSGSQDGPMVIYPNPAHGLITVTFPSAQKGPVEMIIFNTSGVALIKETVFEAKDFILDLSMYQSGMYFLRIQDSNHRYTQRLVLR